MPVKDPAKNREYVARHRAMKKANEETRKEYNQLNASYIEKHRNVLKETLGTKEFNNNNAEYMRQYRAKQKQAKQEIQNNKATTIQSAIRNKFARKALLQQKQNKLNEVIYQINQQRQAKDKQQLFNKLNASVNANDILNDLFANILSQIPDKKRRGRPPKK